MAIEKTITDEIGRQSTYFRIVSDETNYDLMQRTVVIACYADQTYRDAEKAEMQANLDGIARYNELTEKEILTEEEADELRSLDIQELEAMKYSDRSMYRLSYGFSISESDIRDSLYGSLKDVPCFDGAEDV